MGNIITFPKRKGTVVEQITAYFKDHWDEPVAKEVEEILTPTVWYGSDMLALQFVRVALMCKLFTEISKPNRELKPGEGWHIKFTYKDGLWTIAVVLSCEISETEMAKELAFLFNYTVLTTRICPDSEGDYIWPEITEVREGMLTLDSVRDVLAFYTLEHPKTEYKALTRSIITGSNNMVPISRRAKIGSIMYGTSVFVNVEAYGWKVVKE